MLTENDVTAVLENHFLSQTCQVTKLTTKQKGIDMIIVDSIGQKTYIEVKGETSANEKSKRFGQPFSGNQIWTHGSVALMKTFELMCRPENKDVRFAIGVPENHEVMFRRIEAVVRKMEIMIYLVSENGVRVL